MSNKKLVLTAIVALIVGIVFGALFAPTSSKLGSVRYVQDQFVAGLKAGLYGELSVDSSGNLVTTGEITSATTTYVALNVYASTTVSGTLTQGGGINSTTTAIGLSAGTVLASYFDTENFITVNVGTTTAATFTLTLPATSTLSTFIPVAGDSRDVLIYAASSTASYITVAPGAGMTLVSASSTKIISAGGTAILKFYRKTNTDMIVYMNSAF